MMRRVALRTLGLFACTFLAVSCSENAPGLLSPGAPRSVSVAPQMAVMLNPPVVISQVYGAGGNASALASNDYVELFNPGTSPVSVGGWSVQYASNTGTTWQKTIVPAGKSIAAGGYFLIKMGATNGSVGAPVPTGDVTGSIAMAAGAGKVLLRSDTITSAGACPTAATLVDLVAYGASSDCDSRGVTPALSVSLAAFRKLDGCTYTGSTLNDFEVLAPAPRSSASATRTCGTVVVPNPAKTVSVTPPVVNIDVGGTQTFVASAADESGAPVTTTYTWSTNRPDVATVDQSGVATGVGSGTAVITARTANGVSNTATLVVNLPPARDVIISQVYGGGGNASAPYLNDYVELFNAGTAAVSIASWSVQYTSATGSGWSSNVTAIPAGVTLQPGQYYLVQLGSGGAIGAALPTADAIGSTNISATAGKVLLARPGITPTGNCPSESGIMDRAYYGSTANCPGPLPAPANATALLRNDAGCATAAADFAVGAPLPRNASSPRHPCHSAPTDPVAVSVSPSSPTVQVGATVNLAASSVDVSGQPSPTTYTWSSNNEAVATVSPTGVVSGVAVGTATIKATSANGIEGAATVTVTAAPPPSTGIVITEIMADPDVVSDAQGEWFEVFNSSSVAVDLNGWEIRSARSTGADETHVIASSVIVPAGGFVVLGNNGNSGTNGGVNVAYVFPSTAITLSNGSDTEWLLLHTAGGATADSVAYSPRNASGTVVDPKFLPTVGVARELIDVVADNAALSSSNWRDATLPYGTGANKGTPGYGAYGVAGPVARIVISPSPASVNIGGTRSLSAIALDALNRISTELLVWSVANENIATIQVNGIVSGLATGSTTVTARAGSGAEATTSLVVVDPDAPASITVSVSDPGWIPVGYQRSVFSTIRNSAGAVVTAPLTYTVSDASILALDVIQGRTYVRGVGAGTANIIGTAANGAFGIKTMTILPATAPTSAVYHNNVEFGIPTDNNPGDDILVTYSQFASSYNSLRGGPNWVSWNLNATNFGPAPRCNCFSVDQTLPVSAYHVTDVDYINSGYDRGHMVQSESRTSTEQDNAATFALTNILPQAALNNQQVWLAFENYLNDFALAGKDVYIVAGGEYAANPPTLKGEGKIAIPDYTWKIAVVMPGGQGLANVTSVSSMQLFVVRMPNLLSTATGGQNWQQYQTTVDAIEAATGYDYLAALPDNIERLIEANDRAPVASPLSPLSGIEHQPIQFNGSGSDPDANDPLTYAWSFGDGGTATGTAATHTYTDIGTFTVRFIVTDSHGVADTASTSVTVSPIPAPAATFTATESVTEGSPIVLSLSNVSAAPGSIVTYAFDCGAGYGAPGSVSSVSCPTADNGSVVVRGRVSNQRGMATEYSASVIVGNVSPTATIQAPSSVNEGAAIVVSLVAAADASPADVAAGFTYAFDCGAGLGDFSSNATASCPTPDDGMRTVRAAIRDKDGALTEYTANVVVTNVAPTASLVAPSAVTEGAAITLSLADATDAGSADVAAGLTFAFDCGTGMGSFTAASSGTCTTTDNGSRTVKAAVRDKNGGTTEYTAVIAITSVAPTATITAPASVVEGSSIAFSLGAATDAASDDTAAGFTYAFSCNGTAPTTFGADQSASCPTSDNGTVIVTAVVRDKDGEVSTYTASVAVTNAAPVVAAFSDATILAGERFETGGSFTDAGADTFVGAVTYGGAVVALPLAGNSFALSNQFLLAGSFTVTVTVTDDDGAAGTRSATVVVLSPSMATGTLSTTVGTMQTAGSIPANTASTLLNTLQKAGENLAAKDNQAGINQMDAFINQVNAARNSGRMSAATAAELVAMANRIVASARL